MTNRTLYFTGSIVINIVVEILTNNISLLFARRQHLLSIDQECQLMSSLRIVNNVCERDIVMTNLSICPSVQYRYCV